VEETHTSQPSLVFFRSITHDRSWITSAGAVLDAAALRSSVLNLPQNARAQLCLRSGYLCLRRIADYFSIPYDDDPDPDDPVEPTKPPEPLGAPEPPEPPGPPPDTAPERDTGAT